MSLSCHQNADQNWKIKIGNKLFLNVLQFKYVETTVINRNLIQEEIERRLNSGNVCYHSVQNLLSSCLLLKNVKIRIYKTIILPAVMYEWETGSLKLREEYRLRVFENRVLKRIVGLRRDDMTWGWRKQHKEELYHLYSSPGMIRIIKSRRMRWMGHVARMGKKRNRYGFLVGKPEGKRSQWRPRHR
jgi:hypothetical protein